MKLNTLITALLFFIPALVFAQPPCTCTPTTEKDNQDRTVAKHETHFSNFKVHKDTITVGYIYKWEKKYAAVTSTITVKPASSNNKRQKATPEDSIYTLKGYLWFVKTEDNDCDFHIELGPKSKSGTRVVVEVPEENEALQKLIKQHLDALNLKILGCGTSDKNKAHFTKGLPVIVTGLGFYDASHKPNTNHGDEHTKKYSWELHPVKSIVFL